MNLSWRRLEARTALGPIQLVSDVLAHGEALLQQGRVQFLLCHVHALAPGRLDEAGYTSLRIGTDLLLPVCAVRAGNPRFALDGPAAGRLPLLAYSAESGLGRVVRALRGEALERARAEPVVTAHLGTLLKTMALDGRGIAWLPRSLIEDELNDGRLASAGGPDWPVEVEIRRFRRRAAEAPVAEAFWRAAGASGC